MKTLKIFMISSPTSPANILRYGEDRIPEEFLKLSEKYDITRFRYIIDGSMTSMRRFYLYHGFRYLFTLFKHLLEQRYHLFITPLFFPEAIIIFILAKLSKKPLIVKDGHWYWPDTSLAKFLWPVFRCIAKYSNLLLVTKGAKVFWRSSKISTKIMVAPLYISLIQIRNEDLVHAEQFKKKFNNKKIILFFGRLVRYKGAEYLIKAFANLLKENNDVFLIIAGEGPEREKLEKLCIDLGINDSVFFTGFVRNEDKPAYFLMCDVFVHPAITEETPEEWGLVVNEAMSVGKPVVVTPAVGARELVIDGVNGYIVPEKNVDLLYKALKNILSNDELRTKMGREAKRTIESFYTHDHSVKILDKAIRSVLLELISKFRILGG
jgi:glycosyltransferase involved in cell wall biosynthesis